MSQVAEFQKEIETYLQTPYAIAVNNGSSALLAALSYLKEVRGIEVVITTPFTFPATANMIILAGMKPLFVDVIKDTGLIDPAWIMNAMYNEVTPPRKTAILPVHLFGQSCNMKEIMWLSEKFEAPVIEDASQAFGAVYDYPKRGIYKCGSMGLMGTFSFYATKNLHTFEGGMIVTNETDIATWLKAFRNHGKNSKSNPMINLGMNLKMPELLAFIGHTNLRLHKEGIEAELGKYGMSDGYYTKLVPNEKWYKDNQDKWISWPIINALLLAEKVRNATK